MGGVAGPVFALADYTRRVNVVDPAGPAAPRAALEFGAVAERLSEAIERERLDDCMPVQPLPAGVEVPSLD